MLSDSSSPKVSLERNIENLIAFKESAILSIKQHRESTIEKIQQDTENIIQELNDKISQTIENLEKALSQCKSGEEFETKLTGKFMLKFQLNTDQCSEAYKKSITYIMCNSKPSSEIIYHFKYSSSSVDALNLLDNSLTSLNDLPFTCFASPSITKLPDDTLFIAGGVDSSTFEAQRTVRVYNPRENTVTTRPDMINQRSYHCAHLLDNFIYLFGGSASDYQNNEGMNESEKFDMNHNRWLPIATLNQRRSAYGSSEFQKKIYIFGGWGTVNSIEMYDPVRDVMTLLDVSLSIPGSSSACVLDQDIIVFHGNMVSLFNPSNHRVSAYTQLTNDDYSWGVFCNYPPQNFNEVIFMVRAWYPEGFSKFDLSSKLLENARPQVY